VSSTGTFDPALIPGGGGTTNDPPTASFAFDCTNLTCSFTDTSADGDGTIASWAWSFGDGSNATVQKPSHTYAAGDTYTVSLTVTDDDGATATTSQDVSVTAPPPPVITLQVATRQVKTNRFADLSWRGANSTNVDVYRNAAAVTTTANDGAYTDKPPKTVTSATYKVCESGTSTCSNVVNVTW